jgi:hypothetical protein
VNATPWANDNAAFLPAFYLVLPAIDGEASDPEFAHWMTGRGMPQPAHAEMLTTLRARIVCCEWVFTEIDSCLFNDVADGWR